MRTYEYREGITGTEYRARKELGPYTKREGANTKGYRLVVYGLLDF